MIKSLKILFACSMALIFLTSAIWSAELGSTMTKVITTKGSIYVNETAIEGIDIKYTIANPSDVVDAKLVNGTLAYTMFDVYNLIEKYKEEKPKCGDKICQEGELETCPKDCIK